MYGVDSGGSGGSGVVFKLNTDGTGFTILYNFTAPTGQNLRNCPINDDGVGPHTLILSGNVLYGTADCGGRWGNGTVFALSTDGSNFATLHNWRTRPNAKRRLGAGDSIKQGKGARSRPAQQL